VVVALWFSHFPYRTRPPYKVDWLLAQSLYPGQGTSLRDASLLCTWPTKGGEAKGFLTSTCKLFKDALSNLKLAFVLSVCSLNSVLTF
jgi:hypothetical protein